MGSLKSGYKIGDFGAKIEEWLKVENNLDPQVHRSQNFIDETCIESFVQLKLNGKYGLVTFTITEELK